MKPFCAIIFALGLSTCHASSFDDTQLSLVESEARSFFANFTAGLIQVNATLLAVAFVVAAIIGAAALAVYWLWLESQNQESSSGYGSGSGYGYGSDSSYSYNQARSAKDGYDFNGLNVIQWISMLQELYEKFDYSDLDCQKKLICEVMREPDYYGTVAQKFKSGFQYAKYLEVLSLPDDMRELLDEYLDANTRADSKKECSEFFQCPYSIKDSMAKSSNGNSL